MVKLTGEGASQIRHQGVVARLTETPMMQFDDLLSKLEDQLARGEKVRLMVCDSLQDPHNIGAIIRNNFV